MPDASLKLPINGCLVFSGTDTPNKVLLQEAVGLGCVVPSWQDGVPQRWSCCHPACAPSRLSQHKVLVRRGPKAWTGWGRSIRRVPTEGLKLKRPGDVNVMASRSRLALSSPVVRRFYPRGVLLVLCVALKYKCFCGLVRSECCLSTLGLAEQPTSPAREP